MTSWNNLLKKFVKPVNSKSMIAKFMRDDRNNMVRMCPIVLAIGLLLNKAIKDLDFKVLSVQSTRRYTCIDLRLR